MGKYIVLAGEKTWDTINGVWAVVKQGSFTPDSVYLLGKERDIEEVKDDITTIFDHYEMDVESLLLVSDGSPGEKIEEVLDGSERVALDVSGATKSFAVEVLIHPVAERFDRVYCLQSSKAEVYRDRPYPVQNREKTVLKELIGGKI